MGTEGIFESLAIQNIFFLVLVMLLLNLTNIP